MTLPPYRWPDPDRDYANGAFIPGAAAYPQRWTEAAASFRQAMGRRAVAVQAGHLGAAAHRHHRLVDLRHRAAVEPQLRLAGLAPARRRGKVQEAEVERLLQFPGVLAGEQHPRDVGLDQAHTTRRVGQHAGLAQAGEQFFGCVHGIGLWGHPGNGSP